MDSNEIKGTARDIGGKLQDAVGGLTGNASLQGEGKMNQAMGKAQDAYGQAVDEVRAYTADQPIATLLTAMGVGVLLGFLLGRR